MHPILRNILAVTAGTFLGGLVNMAIITLYPSIFPLPFDCPTTDNDAFMKCYMENIHLLEFKHLVSVFLAHALGTLTGAFLACKIGSSKKLLLAMLVGLLFFLGGLKICSDLNWQPLAFSIVDLIFAFFPFAWLGWIIARRK